MKNKTKKILLIITSICVIIIFFVYVSQVLWAHRNGFFVPDYKKIELTATLAKSALEPDDYNIIFRQTGLGRSAVEHLLTQGDVGKSTIVDYQQSFFAPKKAKCAPMLGWFTREDILVDDNGERTYGPEFISVQPGDIIITLATHSLGWNHGHSAIVIDENTTLESRVLGQNSTFANLDFWRTYANYIVLRVKDISSQLAEAVVEFSKQYLFDTPYRLTAGLVGEKAIAQESNSFGLQCAYLVWYAWQNFEVDLDSDGGRLVSPLDILLSDRVEVVQIYGINPNLFIE